MINTVNEHGVFIDSNEYIVINEKRFSVTIYTATDGLYWYGAYDVSYPLGGNSFLPSPSWSGAGHRDPFFSREITAKQFYLRRAKKSLQHAFDYHGASLVKHLSILKRVKLFSFIEKKINEQLSLFGGKNVSM